MKLKLINAALVIIAVGIVLLPMVAVKKELHTITTEVKQEDAEIPLQTAVEEKKEETKIEEPKQEESKKETETKKVETPKQVVKKETTTKTQTKKTTTQTNQKGTPAGTYKITHYGWDCCKNGVTATGYNVRNTIYYNDSQYGKVRIVAMHGNMPLYSIIKIKKYKLGGDIVAIVIDRGVGRGTIDLLVENEATASKYGIQKGVSIEILRKGK